MGLAIVDKRRPKANVSEVMNIIGDVRGKTCILYDDLVDTAGSLCNAAKALVEIGGAKEIYACATHGVLSGPAYDRIEASPIKEMVLLNTIPEVANTPSHKIKFLDVAPCLPVPSAISTAPPPSPTCSEPCFPNKAATAG